MERNENMMQNKVSDEDLDQISGGSLYEGTSNMDLLEMEITPVEQNPDLENLTLSEGW